MKPTKLNLLGPFQQTCIQWVLVKFSVYFFEKQRLKTTRMFEGKLRNQRISTLPESFRSRQDIPINDAPRRKRRGINRYG